MSIVIKGMDKPKTCFNCPCKMYDEVDSVYCAAIDGEPYIDDEDNGVLPDCPISALPQKHGGLIDADFLLGRLKEFAKGYDPNTFHVTMLDVYRWLEYSTAIIEAEDGE